MENNNAIATEAPKEEKVKVEDVKPTTEDEDSPQKERGYRQRTGRRPYNRNREIKIEDESGKWQIRKNTWDHLEDNDLVNIPRPCHLRIPNFEGAAEANNKLASLEAFKKAKTVKVNPDKPQTQARILVLEEEKELVLLNQSQRNYLQPLPEPGKTGVLNRVVPGPDVTKEELRQCCTSQGVKDNSKEVPLDEKVKIDLLVVGSVAVSRKGFRIGKGKGYADLEYAMMRTMGAIDDNTVVVTSVHDSQVVDIPEDLVGEHDMTVDYILTPTELIETNCKRPKPKGVIWDHLEVNKFFQIPVLRQVRDLERDAGKNVMIKGQENEDEDPLEREDANRPPPRRRFRRYGGGGQSRGGGRGGRSYNRYRGGGRRRRMDGGDDSNKENAETGDESGAEVDTNDNRPRPPRRNNYRNRRFRRGGKPRGVSESELSDAGGEMGQGDADEKPRERRYQNNRRRYQRRRYDGPNRRDNRGGGDRDHSGSDGEQKNSADEEGRRRPLQKTKFRTNPDAVVFVGALSRKLRVSKLKNELRSNNLNPMRLVWHGGKGYAFLHYQTVDTAKEAVDCLTGRELEGKEVFPEMANNRRKRGGDSRSDRQEVTATEEGDK